jgi:hypothetical protein
MSLIASLPKNDGGFFCQIWKLVSKYLLAKRFNTPFYIDDSQWMFRHTSGWYDYFTTLNIITPTASIQPPIYFDIDERYMDQFSLNEYRDAFKDIYIFNESLQERFKKTLEKYNLLDEYDAIMIRRGDKMYGESEYISTEIYVNKLLEKNTKKVFVQTDDYNAYLEVCNLIKEKDENIVVITTCPNDKLGCFVFNYSPEVGSTLTKENDTYLKNLTNLPKKKSVNQYNSEEMKEHVEEMLIGLQICLKSRILVTDYQSNVTRMLVVNHETPSNVINIGKETSLNFDTPMRCPTYGFIKTQQ